MDNKEFSEILNKSRNELKELLSNIKNADPSKEVVSFLIETIEQMIDLGEQSYSELRERLMVFNEK
jgi:hypothetical protein